MEGYRPALLGSFRTLFGSLRFRVLTRHPSYFPAGCQRRSPGFQLPLQHHSTCTLISVATVGNVHRQDIRNPVQLTSKSPTMAVLGPARPCTQSKPPRCPSLVLLILSLTLSLSRIHELSVWPRGDYRGYCRTQCNSKAQPWLTYMYW